MKMSLTSQFYFCQINGLLHYNELHLQSCTGCGKREKWKNNIEMAEGGSGELQIIKVSKTRKFEYHMKGRLGETMTRRYVG